MSGPTIDPERLAALLDGRLEGREREELLARLAGSERDVAALTDAAAALRALEEDAGVAPGAGTRMHSLDARRPAAPGRRRWLLAAAAVAVLALVPALRSRLAGGRPARVEQLAALVADDVSGLPRGWDGTPWGATRGAGAPITATGRGVRVGARLLDLELLVRAGDSAGTAGAARDVAAVLGDEPGSGAAVALLRAVERQAGTDSAAVLLPRARDTAELLADEEAVRLGAWLEAARLAAGRDAGFFRETAAVHDAAVGRLPAGSAERVALERARAEARRGTPADWRAVERDLTAALRGLAR